ncbi:MAG: alkaline phosphatase [Bacteroidota bacterium]|nr:alkaline phosphatase [Bacteroidota bacterium]
MVRICLIAALLFLTLEGSAQFYSPSNVFAHNDYVRATPFHTAYDLRVGFIEADVFLWEGTLMVAHQESEIQAGKDFETLYLKPLAQEVKRNGGFAYPDVRDRLTIMIDLKTEGPPTLDALVKLLDRYPALTSCKNLQFMISGNVPDPGTWDQYPLYIFIDGRPNISYTTDQLKRVSMISTSFKSHVSWDGHSALTETDRTTISSLMADAHRKRKVFRFWATPDFPEAWKQLMQLQMDVLVTDNVTGLCDFLKENGVDQVR